MGTIPTDQLTELNPVVVALGVGPSKAMQSNEAELKDAKRQKNVGINM